MVTVIDKVQVSLNMLRLTLHSEELGNHIAWHPGCYIKLLIPNAQAPNGKLKARTYTIRSHDPQARTMTVDFAIHHPAGPATDWALKAQIGDEIGFRGPGQLKIDATQGDWYIFAADMAALPAAISVMESLPIDARGYAFLEVMDEKDKQALSIPAGIEVNWLIHPNPKIKSAQQLEAIKAIKHLAGEANIFVSGELETIREIKAYLENEERFKDNFRYISSYWKIGLQEEEHKIAKREALSS